MGVDRWLRLLPGLWAGLLVCVAAVATPAPFATLAQADAGRVVARILAQEAYLSLVLGVVLLVLARLSARRQVAAGTGSQFSIEMGLAIASLFCTIAGYFALQPLMAEARAGQGRWSFGQLHAASALFYLIKSGVVLAFAWRASFRPGSSS